MKTLILIAAILFSANTQADIYKHLDKNGKPYYTNSSKPIADFDSTKNMSTVEPNLVHASDLPEEPKKSGLDRVIDMAWMLVGFLASVFVWIYEKISSITFMQIAAAVAIWYLAQIRQILILMSYR